VAQHSSVFGRTFRLCGRDPEVEMQNAAALSINLGRAERIVRPNRSFEF